MQIEKLKNFVTECLNDSKALDLVMIDVHEITTLTDAMIICTGRSSRHVTSIAQSLVTAAKKAKLSYINIEGEKEGEWVIVDLADIVIHIMQRETREFYNLEDLWEPVEQFRERRLKAK